MGGEDSKHTVGKVLCMLRPLVPPLATILFPVTLRSRPHWEAELLYSQFSGGETSSRLFFFFLLFSVSVEPFLKVCVRVRATVWVGVCTASTCGEMCFNGTKASVVGTLICFFFFSVFRPSMCVKTGSSNQVTFFCLQTFSFLYYSVVKW